MNKQTITFEVLLIKRRIIPNTIITKIHVHKDLVWTLENIFYLPIIYSSIH